MTSESDFSGVRPSRVEALREPAILLTSYMTGAAEGDNMGVAGYSYDIVTQLFIPLLQRWGRVIPVPDPQRNLDRAVQDVRASGLEPVHVSFRAIQDVCLADEAANIVVPAWEFPDVPDHAFNGNPRNDWPAIANRCALVMVGGEFTRVALKKSGTTTPIEIVPVPTPDAYFRIPLWGADDQTTLPFQSYTFNERCQREPLRVPRPALRPRAARPVTTRRRRVADRVAQAMRGTYRRCVKPMMSERMSQTVWSAWQAAKVTWARTDSISIPTVPEVDLSGVVYTSILNPIDGRKNWQDLLTGFLVGLGDHDDATLVVKLITSHPHAVKHVLGYYHRLDIPHRCKVVFVTDYLSDAQMVQLAEASTYYVQTTKAEGNCLPLMNYLAAGRPGISPQHTAIGDYFDEEIGFVVDSHEEPAAWPHDRRLRVRTTWHRLVWTSLVDQLRNSYDVAKNDPSGYDALADRARQRLAHWASETAIWPRLEVALNQLPLATSSHPIESAIGPDTTARRSAA